MLLGAGLLSLSSCRPVAPLLPRQRRPVPMLKRRQRRPWWAVAGRGVAAATRTIDSEVRDHGGAARHLGRADQRSGERRLRSRRAKVRRRIAPHLLETTQQREGCAITGTRLRCFMRFAIGANQAPGRWTVIAKKRTEPAATVRIGVTFNLTGTG